MMEGEKTNILIFFIIIGGPKSMPSVSGGSIKRKRGLENQCCRMTIGSFYIAKFHALIGYVATFKVVMQTTLK